MKHSIIRLLPLVLAAAVSVPAHATCTLPQEAVLPAADIILVSPKGKSISHTTRQDGTILLKGLRKGEWKVRFADRPDGVAMQVSGNGKLSIKSVTVSYSCSAPGGPVNHIQSNTLKQLNKATNP